MTFKALSNVYVRCELCDALAFDPRNSLCQECGNDMAEPDLWRIEMYAEMEAHKEVEPDDEAEEALHWLAQMIKENWA